MKNLLIYAMLIATTLLASCNNEDANYSLENNEVLTELGVTPSLSNIVATRASITSFANGAEIGLFVTSGSVSNEYNNVTTNANVKSRYNSSSNTWSQTPAVYLSSVDATIYAYYPYNSSSKQGDNINIEHGTQTDYLYGTHSAGQSAINNGNSRVNLTMHHALALLQFKINRSNYTGVGKVTSITVGNASGKTCVFNRATMSIQTGVLTNTVGQNSSASIVNQSGLYTIPTTASSVENPNLRLMLLPVSAIQRTGDVTITFTIDNKNYTWDVPANTTWKSGTKNTYTVTITGTELIISNVSITDWTDGTNGNIILD